MQTFTKRIDLGSEFDPEFIFNKIYTITSAYYLVSVKDKEGNTHCFSIEKTSDTWKVIDAPKIPDWIISLEKELIQEVFTNQFKQVPEILRKTKKIL